MCDKCYNIKQCNSDELKKLKSLSYEIDEVNINLPINELLVGQARSMLNSVVTVITRTALKKRAKIRLVVRAESNNEDAKLASKIKQLGHRLAYTGVTLYVKGDTKIKDEITELDSIEVID